MALEVIAVAISHPRLGGIFHPEHPTSSMKLALQDMVCAAVYCVQHSNTNSNTQQTPGKRKERGVKRLLAYLQLSRHSPKP